MKYLIGSLVPFAPFFLLQYFGAEHDPHDLPLSVLFGAIAGVVSALLVWAFFPGKSDCKDDYQTINTGL